jgi:hypothetical protein
MFSIFLQKVRKFYTEAVVQIKTRFPIGDPLLDMFEILDANTHQGNHSKYPSLVPLAIAFPNILPSSSLQLLDNAGMTSAWNCGTSF